MSATGRPWSAHPEPRQTVIRGVAEEGPHIHHVVPKIIGVRQRVVAYVLGTDEEGLANAELIVAAVNALAPPPLLAPTDALVAARRFLTGLSKPCVLHEPASYSACADCLAAAFTAFRASTR